MESRRNDYCDPWWSRIENSVKAGNLQEVITNVGKSYNATASDYGGTVLHLSAEQDHLDIAKHLIENGAYVESKTTDGDTPLSAAAYSNSIKVAQLLLQHRANKESKDKYGNTPLSIAVSNNSGRVAELLLEHGADVENRNKAGNTPLLVATDYNKVEMVQLLLDHGADVESRNNAGDTPLLVAADYNKVEMVQLLLKHGADLTVRNKAGISPLLNIDDPKRRCLFYRGNLYCRVINVFLDKGGDDVSLLGTIYIALQAKVKCDQPNKDVLKNELDSIPGLYERFHARIRFLATNQTVASELTDSSKWSELEDLKIIAEQIYSEYLKEKKNNGFCAKMCGFFETIATKLKSCCGRQNAKQRIKGHDKKTKKKRKDRCPSLPTEVYHKCTARDKITATFCLLGIVFYILDLYTDVVVGIEDLQGFSLKLGIFELFLVVFTLCHENYRSSNSVYATRGELLRIQMGKPDLEDKDWKRTELNWSGNRYIRGFYKFCCPFKVKGTPGLLNKFKAIIYNVLTCLQLRPVVDRLVVLLHAPTNLRDYYRRQTEQNCLKQFYLILEQLPELLVQFYTFQIVYNNLSASERLKTSNDSCYQYFAYRKLNPNNTNHTNLFCDNISLSVDGLTTCGTLFRIFSMAIPFYNIPSGIVSLENGFRRLDPLTPKMPTSLKSIFQVSYMLMIPARVFMFAAAMHAVSFKEYVMGYLILRAILELLLNLYSVKDYPAYFKKRSIGQKVSTMWRLCLFSIRDVFLISIRDPVAYLSKPSEVSNSSLRHRTNFALRCIPLLWEGVVAAVLIELRYPCGKHSHNFKYLGWICWIPLLFSLSTMVMISDLFHPKTIRSSSPTLNNFNYMKKYLLISLTSIVISGIAAVAFFLTQPRSFVTLLIMGVVILVNLLLNAGLILFLFIKKLNCVKESAEDAEQVNSSAEGVKEIDDKITESGESAPSLEIQPSSSAQNIAHLVMGGIYSSKKNDDPNVIELNEIESAPLLEGPSSSVLNVELVPNWSLDPSKKVGSKQNDKPGTLELYERTPSIAEPPDLTADYMSLAALGEVSFGDNEEPDVLELKESTLLLDKPSSFVRDMELDVFKEMGSKENVNVPTTSDSMC